MKKSPLLKPKVTFSHWLNYFEEEARKEKIELSFIQSNPTKIQKVVFSDYTIGELLKLSKRIIDFTPENCNITVGVKFSKRFQRAKLTIQLNGIDLLRITEIQLSTQLLVDVKRVAPKSTLYTITIPKDLNQNWQKPLNFSPYYIEVNNRLEHHFTNMLHKGFNSFNLSVTYRSFLKRINKLLEIHLQDQNFRVAELASAMAFSRSQLYRKMKLVTNMSPNKYILFYKLQLAEQLLKDINNNLTVTEVCFASGFLSKSHFTRTFKQQFAVNPSMYKKQLHATYRQQIATC